MALSNRINMRIGGGTLGKYLYKDGFDDISKTGGLSQNGYTFSTYHPNTGVVSFEANDVRFTTTATPQAAVMGTTLPIDVTDMTSIIAHATINGEGKVFTLDVSNISGNKYISVCTFDNADNRYFAGLTASDTKTNIYTTSGTILGHQQVSSTTMYLDSIQYA